MHACDPDVDVALTPGPRGGLRVLDAGVVDPEHHLGGGSSQWDPCLAKNQKIIGTPDSFYDEEHPYYFPDAMADRAVEWLHGVRAQDAGKPFFLCYSTGCSHAPHHVAKDWADKYKGKFDR
jgi:arylsulfatase A-like enzyme